MDDSISIKSSDSTTTSDEYEFIPLTTNVSRHLIRFITNMYYIADVMYQI